MRTITSFLVFTGLITGTAALGNAALINVDFNAAGGATQSGAAILGAAGDTWNAANGNSESNLALVDSTNTASGVTLTYTDPDGIYNGNTDNFMYFYSTPYQNLMTDYLTVQPPEWGGSTSLTVTLKGLTHNGIYNLILYSASDSTNRKTTFTVNGIYQSVLTTNATTFILGKTYTNYAAATADASGQLVITYAEGNDDEGDLDGLQITLAVPEPSSISLLAAAFGATTLIRRRSRAATSAAR